jgi:hypothetical protein
VFLIFLTSSREKTLLIRLQYFVSKSAKTHLRPSEIGKNFPGVIPRTPEGRGEEGKKGRIGRGKGGKGEEREGKEREERRGGATAPPKMFVCPRP